MPIKSANRGAPAPAKIGPVGKVLGLDPGDIVKSFKGTLTAIFEPKEFEGKRGAFTIQNCDLDLWDLNGRALDDVQKIRLAIFNETLPDDWKGADIQGLAKKNRGAIQGITYETNVSAGKLYEQFKITQTADIELCEDGEEQAPSTRREPPPRQERQEPPQSTHSAPREMATHYDQPKKSAALNIGDIISCVGVVHGMCIRYARENLEFKDEQAIQAAAATLLIASDRRGAVDIAIKELSGEKPKSAGTVGLGTNKQIELNDPPKDKHWAEAVMPEGSKHKGKKLVEIPKSDQYELYKWIMQKREATNTVSAFGKLVLQMADDLGYTKQYEKELWDQTNPADNDNATAGDDGRKQQEVEDDDIPY